MAKHIKLVVILLLGWIVVSCNATSTQDAQMKQAAALYEEALTLEEKVAPLVEELIQRRNSLSVQGRALSGEEQNFIDRVYALEERFAKWKESRIAMPIQSEEETTSAKPPSEWLRTQEAYRKEIAAIQSEAIKLTTDN
jgi:hypothetical protein